MCGVKSTLMIFSERGVVRVVRVARMARVVWVVRARAIPAGI